MPAIKIMGFDGLVPRTSPTLLSDTQAQTANNVKLYSRELRFWAGSLAQTATVRANSRSIYRYYASAADPYWLTFANSGVDVVRSPSSDTTDYRIYYTGDGVPKKANETLVTTGTGAYPRGWYNLGVPAPTGAPTVSATGGSGTPESRVYVYTYISTFGSVLEESAPSPASSIVSVLPGGTVTVGGFTAAPTTNYNITHRRIYRSVTGSSAVNYQFVAEIPVATTSYADSLTTAQLGEVITTIGWKTPPANMAGLITLPSGSLAGFSGNTIHFSEPYFPHAWPLEYALTIPAKVVGLGIFGTTVVVMTDSYPYLINGGIVGSMSVERVPIMAPCLSKTSIVSDATGVVYATPEGLMRIGPGGAGIMTNALFRRQEWQVYNLANMVSGMYDGRYVAFFPQVTTSVPQALAFSADDIPALSTIEASAYACHTDIRNGNMYFLDDTDNTIYQLDADTLVPLNYTWKSKRFVLPQATTFSAIQLDADYSSIDVVNAYNQALADILAYNATVFANPLNAELNATPVSPYDVNGSTMQNLPRSASYRTVQVNIYSEGELATSINFNSLDTKRIPPFKGRVIEVEITGTIPVRSLTMATTTQEIHQ